MSAQLRALLVRQLAPVAERLTQSRRNIAFAAVLTVGAVLAAGMLVTGVSASAWWMLLGATGLTLAVALRVARERRVDLHDVARRIETENPELRALLLTAVEQDPETAGHPDSYLQERLFHEAAAKAIGAGWGEGVARRQARAAVVWSRVALVAFVLCLLPGFVRMLPWGGAQDLAAHLPGGRPGTPAAGFVVEPGDVEVERGSRVPVRAVFDPSVAEMPDAAELVVTAQDGSERRLPMQPTLEDPVLTALVEDVQGDLRYRVATAAAESDTFAIKTFVLPALGRSDALVRQPAWAGGGEETVEDTLRVSLAEGGNVRFTFTLNKPVAAGWLEPVKDKDGHTEGGRVDLGGGPVLVAELEPGRTATWRLHLEDEAGRRNRERPEISVLVKRNLPPTIELAFPKSDVEATPLQEVPLEATIWDDFGVLSAGLRYQLNGEERTVPFDPVSFRPDTKNGAETMLDLEALGAAPNDMVTFHFFAEDEDGKGERRAVESDLYFVEVRHFEEIFREGPPSAGGEGPPGGGGQMSDELMELQKKVITATWNVQRKSPREPAGDDVRALLEGQQAAITKAAAARELIQDSEMALALDNAVAEMEEAAGMLEVEGPDLGAALTHERAAYAHLLKMRAREFQISRASQSSSSSARSQARQRQLMQMDMKEEESRYETERQAAQQQQQAEQRQEDSEIMDRLNDLAQRQEGVADKLKELEAALAAAETEEEREEIRRQLKRLRDEQRELVDDMDALGQRMDEEQNRARTSEAREQLDGARQSAQQASQQMEQGDVRQASNEATRSVDELEQTAEEFRNQSSEALAEAVRDLREDARALAEDEEALGREIAEREKQRRAEPERTVETGLENAALARMLEQQREALEQLLAQMQEVSEQAEASEPVLSRTLYDAVRDARTAGADGSLEDAARMAQWGRLGEAAQDEAEAREEIEQLAQTTESAAESILGDEAAALRTARAEIERLRQAIEAERPSQQPTQPKDAEDGGPQSEDPTAPNSQGNPDRMAAQDQEEGQEQAQAQGQGQGERPGQAPEGEEEEARGEGQGQGQEQQQARSEGQGQGQGEGEGEGEGQEQQQAQGQGEGQGQGDGGQQQARGGQEGEGQEEGQGQGRGGRRFFDTWAGAEDAGGDGGGGGGDRLGPLTGDDYREWSERLRDVEDMVGDRDLRLEAEKIRGRARELRRDFNRNNREPEWEVVETELVEPLKRLERAVHEELLKRESPDALAPVDRDPVPRRFEDLVRQYYEELGSGY